MGGELLCNGIRLPESWPPRDLDPLSREPQVPPYLEAPPELIPLDGSRQLLVDDFLIQHTTLRRTYHQAQKYAGNPVLTPRTTLEETGARYRDAGGYSPPFACTFDDGVFYDPTDGRFKMWYAAGSGTYTALAYSDDGLHWERPAFDVVPGTNAVLVHPGGSYRDSFSPWIDAACGDAEERYKAFLYTTGHTSDLGPPLSPPVESLVDRGWLYSSPDGVHWRRRARLQSHVGDNTMLFYNPFRARWCLSIRGGPRGRGRARRYLESAEFLGLAALRDEDQVFWSGADDLDAPEPGSGEVAQLYGIAAAPYESLLLGVFTLHYGPPNSACLEGGFPKLTELQLGYSRDGFHWSRPRRSAFIAASRRESDPERGYLRAAGGCCVVSGDRLYFYYCGFSGIAADGRRHMYAGGGTHVAFLRRDGFASLDAGPAEGELLTRPVTLTGGNLFVNVSNPGGELRVEVVDTEGAVIAPFAAANCLPIAADSTAAPVRWHGAADLSAVAGRPLRLRFRLTAGSLYAFWISS